MWLVCRPGEILFRRPLGRVPQILNGGMEMSAPVVLLETPNASPLSRQAGGLAAVSPGLSEDTPGRPATTRRHRGSGASSIAMKDGLHFSQSALPCRLLDQGTSSPHRTHMAVEVARLPRRYGQWTRRIQPGSWRRGGSCPSAPRLEGNALSFGFHARAEKGILDLGAGEWRYIVRMAGWLRRVHSQRVHARACAPIHPETGTAPREAGFRARAERSARKARCGIRSEISGMTRNRTARNICHRFAIRWFDSQVPAVLAVPRPPADGCQRSGLRKIAPAPRFFAARRGRTLPTLNSQRFP